MVYAFAQEGVTMSDTLCSPLRSISNARHSTGDKKQLVRAARPSSARARGVRRSGVGRRALVPTPSRTHIGASTVQSCPCTGQNRPKLPPPSPEAKQKRRGESPLWPTIWSLLFFPGL